MTDPDLIDLDAVRAYAEGPKRHATTARMLTRLADALESLRERYRMAEVIADIARLKVRADDTPVPLKDGDKMPIVLAWVCRVLAGCLEAKGAPNYFGWGWTDEETGKSYRVRVQHETGKSPECVAAEARAELVNANTYLEMCNAAADRAAGDADLVIARIAGERDELAATLANERGEGAGPSDGWAVVDGTRNLWRHESGAQVGQSVNGWAAYLYDGEGMRRWSEPARAAMVAADLARSPK